MWIVVLIAVASLAVNGWQWWTIQHLRADNDDLRWAVRNATRQVHEIVPVCTPEDYTSGRLPKPALDIGAEQSVNIPVMEFE